MRPIRTVRAGIPAPFASLGHLLSSHRAITRVGAAALVFTVIIGFSQHTSAQAGPEASRPVPTSLLPENLGSAIATSESVEIAFAEPMNATSVEAALRISPTQPAALSWSDDATFLSISPKPAWQADSVYLVTVGEAAETAAGTQISVPRRFAFSTELAPAVSGFQVRLAQVDLPQAETAEEVAVALSIDESVTDESTLSPAETAREVSASSSVRISFTARMNRAATEEAFSIAPEVAGELTWEDGDLVFSPSERLEAGGRYTINLRGARDESGSEIDGKSNFSFVIRAGPQLVRTTPTLDAADVDPATVEMWFSQPMDVDATNTAFSLTDTSTGQLVAGRLNWNEDATQIVYSPDARFAGGRTFEVTLGEGAVDANGNPIVAEWSFTTAERAPDPVPTTREAAAPATAGGAEPPARAAVAFVPGPASGLEGYGLNQINAARAAYGFPPLVLDPTLSAMASAHAWDQINRGYYAHSARPGGYAAWGENQCHASMGLGAQGTMDWCHSVFMSEPWPGHWNHIGNILSARYTRVGIGVGDNGSRVVITWDFAN